MCGIAGIVGAARDCSQNLVDMLQAQAHRGPDGSRFLAYEGGAAGAVRLALVDLSERGQMPMWSPDGRVAIVFNGEMYNYVPERQRLASRAYPFRSTTDTEVILALYLEHGLSFVDHIRGMFALAILDWRQSTPGGRPTLVLARDHFGIKPLYVAWPQGPRGPLVFASEIRSLLASGLVPREIDTEALQDYLAIGFVLQPKTIIAGVEMLQPGSLIRITPAGSIERRRFWSMPPAQPVRESFEESAERLRAVLDESVSLHALADAPVGAFLSGGIDSSGVVGLMIRENPRLRTYSLRTTDFPQSDEADQAEAFARSLGCEHTTVEVSGREVLELLPRFAAELDQPSTDGLNTWLISKWAARDVKGVLSGLGGDEWFSGYPSNLKMTKLASASGRPRAWIGRLAGAVRALAPDTDLGRRLEHVASLGRSLSTWVYYRRIFGYGWAARLVKGAGLQRNGYREIEHRLASVNPEWCRESILGLACLLDVDVYMRSQLLRDSDATSMASSLELRVPLVDLRVAEFSRSCADDFKLNRRGSKRTEYVNTGAKRVLIEALKNVLPANVARRPKRGFSLPCIQWMETSLQPLLREICSRRVLAERGLLDPDLAVKLALCKSTQRPPSSLQAWSLMILELWCRAVIDIPAPQGKHAMGTRVGRYEPSSSGLSLRATGQGPSACSSEQGLV
jgi:asparagine synthase (glutamine-hydrolysing)